MNVLRVLIDNSTAVLAWLTSLFGLLTLLDVIQLTETQVGGIITFAGSTLGVLAIILTVAKRKVIATVTSEGTVVAGQASTAATGTEALGLREPNTGNVVPLLAVKPALAKPHKMKSAA